MQQIPQSQHLSGQCPNCGWTPPLQNAFRPNIMNEYIGPDGRMVVLSETDDEVKSTVGVFLRNRDDEGRKIRRAIATQQPNNPPFQQQQMQQTSVSSAAPATAVQTSGFIKEVIPTPKAAPTSVLPSKDIPAGLMKTPEEVAATPKDKVTPAPVVLPTPIMSNTAAPAQTANTQTDIKQP